MHMLSIHFGPSQMVWGLLFKEKERGERTEKEALEFMRSQHLTQQIADNRMVTLEDDFGQRCHLVSGAIHGVMLEDCDLTQESYIQKALHQERTRVKAQTRARGDAVLKAAGMGAQMPSFDPMANGRFSQ